MIKTKIDDLEVEKKLRDEDVIDNWCEETDILRTLEVCINTICKKLNFVKKIFF